ncbi:MAG TPA: energy transducer TonB [Thermoanaerobaculia bacterium]|nr:energy transducer TonB [Thermoanaerobaculia bacterium]HUM28905.1 energy transducer TonB [Thermoanaerobaculia bacterium]HXK67162.1 energy transducer TonB [Thermoanaerobaculia bacterium]
MTKPTAIKHERAFLETLARESKEDAKHTYIALVIAVIIHVVLFAWHFPEGANQAQISEQQTRIFVMKPPKFKPPEKPKEQQIPKPKTKKVPIPDPTPDEPEPIREPEPEIADEIPPDMDVLFGVPEAPPAIEEKPINVGGDIEAPEKLDAPQPLYPEIARKARIQGIVILQLTVTREGRVEDVKVLRGLPMGCTEAAIDAVQKWKFKPAYRKSTGLPVKVYYTVTVKFSID